jgi:hypothetical protein
VEGKKIMINVLGWFGAGVWTAALSWRFPVVMFCFNMILFAAGIVFLLWIRKYADKERAMLNDGFKTLMREEHNFAEKAEAFLVDHGLKEKEVRTFH